MEDELGGHKNKTSHGGNKHASSASGSHHRHRHKSLPPQAVTEVDPQRKKQLHIPVPPPVAEDAVLADGQISPPSAPPSAPSSAAPTPTQRITKAASEMHIQSGNAPADTDVNADRYCTAPRAINIVSSFPSLSLLLSSCSSYSSIIHNNILQLSIFYAILP